MKARQRGAKFGADWDWSRQSIQMRELTRDARKVSRILAKMTAQWRTYLKQLRHYRKPWIDKVFGA